MSFIVAKKYKNKIKVMADDKLYVSPNDVQMLIKEIGDKDFEKDTKLLKMQMLLFLLTII